MGSEKLDLGYGFTACGSQLSPGHLIATQSACHAPTCPCHAEDHADTKHPLQTKNGPENRT
jgi:hypothetical protein